MSRELPVVTIVGRPNVGKSALFNRLIGQRKSIVADRPGVTRDRIYAECEWEGRAFLLADTGGIDPKDPDVLRQQVFSQARVAIEESSVLVLVVDGQEGIHPVDEEVASILRQGGRPALLAVNKLESPKDEAEQYQFYTLGLGDPLPISAIHGVNTADLLDHILEALGPERETGEEDDEVAVALLGRPNVGKSSLTNRLVGHERSVVHEVAGTTRDSLDSFVNVEEQRVRLVDTAGLRRKAKVTDEVEYYSSLRALSALKRAQVGVLVLDAQDGVVSQDKRVAGELLEHDVAILVLVNKWDLIPGLDSPAKIEEFKTKFAEKLAYDLDFISYAPVLFVSAKTGEGTDEILPTALAVYDEWSRRVPTPVVNQVIREAVELRPPPSYKGQHLKVYYATQSRNRPPTFVLKVNSPKLVHFSYERYLLNQLREAFGFVGTPIKLKFVR